jgi:hypothetical protein
MVNKGVAAQKCDLPDGRQAQEKMIVVRQLGKKYNLLNF